MNLKTGIVGLPNAGKSTLFGALTSRRVNISNYPFCTIEPNVGVVPVPDERLKKLAELSPEAEIIPAAVEMVDVAGLVKGAAEGEGLGNKFLSHLFPMDALMFLLRCFRDENVISANESPEEQLQILRLELEKKDEEIFLRNSAKKNPEGLAPAKLGEKPALIVCNTQNGKNCGFEKCQMEIDCKLELELSQMNEAERKELGRLSRLNELISAVYRTLDLITFYTLKGGKELRAWPIRRGTPAREAAGIVHGDFKEKFIRAEVINWEKLAEAGSWAKAKESGLIRTEGKEYEVSDGDAVEFKI